ncbi:glycosyltransferase family 2 protein [Dechloromonas sp. HYN0024]|uniref:glycosyltransferase family 2 protein n=1 Tax=Dechloromonas sp. HYN0024 TaxID=2231055 RepID=UPI000E450725|nr:glycosyltransferase family 2 protein [Dechloromonas sp. HYN0024]AXS80110.1 glycosyltransferase family 2 protein [Dechloromonas sp. HYN0024]
MTNRTPPEISVCVCTYKRPSLLQQLLESLAQQNLSLSRFEIIVVDNDASGSARQIVEQVAQRFPELAIRYEIETNQGISYARNRTVSLATGQFLAFIDDDEWAVDNWLTDLMACIKASGADAVLGPVIPQYPADSHAWAIKSRFFERPRFATGTMIGCDTCRTGNALVRADRLNARQPHPFDERLALSGGEDHDFFKWCASEGGRFVWCDTAEVNEAVPLHRQDLRFILERCFRTSTRYWRDEYAVRSQWWALYKAIAGLIGGPSLILLGVLLLPFGLGKTIRTWGKGINGLGRVAALRNVPLVGYGKHP